MTIQDPRSVTSGLFGRRSDRSQSVPPRPDDPQRPLTADPAPHRLTVAARPTSTALTVELRGAIDAGTLGAVDAALRAALARVTGAVHAVLIDSSAVDFISATGLSRLLWFVAAAAERGAVCTVVGGTAVARPAEVLGLRPLLPVYPTVAAAQAAGTVA